MVPPPAPSVRTLSIGVPMSWPATAPRRLVDPALDDHADVGAGAAHVEGQHMALRAPRELAAAIRPAAGPDEQRWLGWRARVAIRTRPPFDCMTNSCGVVTRRAQALGEPRR